MGRIVGNLNAQITKRGHYLYHSSALGKGIGQRVLGHEERFVPVNGKSRQGTEGLD